MEFVIGYLGLWALSIQHKIPGWGCDGGRSRFIPLSKKMADVVLLVSELEDNFDFINVIVEDDDGLNACWGRIK